MAYVCRDDGPTASDFGADELRRETLARSDELHFGRDLAAAGVEQLDMHLDEELQQLARVADRAEFAEGLAAFFDKRPPAFP